MPITENPTIDLTERDVVVLYMTGGCAIFGCTGDPEGVIFANNPSLALSTNGNVYFKTTNRKGRILWQQQQLGARGTVQAQA